MTEIGACACDRDACDRDGVDLDREGELIQKWVQRQRDGYRERESNISKKMGREREREREKVYVQGLVEGNNKKIEKIDYLNKRSDRIDELM